MNEFCDRSPNPRRGFTSIEALAFLKNEFPQVEEWTCWVASRKQARVLAQLVKAARGPSGTAQGWSWSPVPCSYPVATYWLGGNWDDSYNELWAGMLQVMGPQGKVFLLFSFLDSSGNVGGKFFASTRDLDLLDRFTEELAGHYFPKNDNIRIDVQGGADLDLTPVSERMFFPKALREDIETQVFMFFEKQESFQKLHLRQRRGFLFVGTPGTGKTMMIRHLIRECYLRHKISISLLQIRCDTNEAELEDLFSKAARRSPGILILEDLDSLTQESHLTRASLLSQLDGLVTKDGLLIIGTTNHPEAIDPALANRPSRFDRVWRFELPDPELRSQYLRWAFAKDTIDDLLLESLVDETELWSFAYLNELRTTAAILSLNQDRETVGEQQVREAMELLSLQFDSARKQHADANSRRRVGFATGSRTQLEK